ncbi:hypothetical protein BJY00DRAFT_296317 [Aspergillus carlsbadensis]|nr:hypothetical protein BJY00DRAFT_296317 [Aspergillus carlsbadensis]
MDGFTTQITFARRDNPVLETEKAYVLDYVAGPDIPRTNITVETVENIPVQDVRKSPLSLEGNGITVTKFVTSMEYSDFADDRKVQTCFIEEAKACLKDTLAAKEVHVLDYEIRRRHAIFPKSTGVAYDAAQPIMVAHGDFTPRDASQRLRDLFGKDAEVKAELPFQFFNFWKPLRGPVRDWPLALCDPLTVDAERDILHVDNVCADRIGEVFNLHYHSDQQWYYLSHQQESEAWVFSGYDSRREGQYGVPHCAVQCPTDESSTPRESIEIRGVAFFEQR